MILKERRIVYISYYNSMFTYTIGRINILNFHRCRCVSNTILTTHTNVTDNRRLNKTKLNICWVLLRSYNYFLLNRKRRKKNSCIVQFFFLLHSFSISCILPYEIVAMETHFEWCLQSMKVCCSQMRLGESVDVMEAVYYYYSY